jgi:outer membrane protein assembly factor BamB
MNLVSTPVIVDDRIFAADSGGKMHCLDLENGHDIGAPNPSDGALSCMSPIAVDGNLIMLSSAGTLHVGRATPEGYEEKAQCDVLLGASVARRFWTPPVLSNAKIYCRNFHGELVCIDVSR